MNNENTEYKPYLHLPSSRLLSDAYRIPVEKVVTEYIGRKWTVRQFMDMDEYASHPSALLSDGTYSVFAKLSEAEHGLDQFEVELAGLRLLSETAGVLTPPQIGLVSAERGVIMVLEDARSIERTPHYWREIGRTLARIHQHKGSYFGLETQGYFGPLLQDNRPMSDWLSFYIERRLWPRLIGAIDSGCLPTKIIRQVEGIISRLPKMDLPGTAPSLLHGDAQQNNFICTQNGVMAIDPAVYYGHPEMDLAYVDYFQPVPDELFEGYQELLPIDQGFEDRRSLWRLPAYLAAVTVEGSAQLPRLVNAIQEYL